MPLINLGRKYNSGCDAPIAVTDNGEDRIDYPTIYIRESEGVEIPKYPEGEFYAVVKMKVAGYRDPSDGEKSIDIEVHSVSAAVDEKKAMKLIRETYEGEEPESVESMFTEEKSKTAFRDSLKDVIKETMIGQGG